MISLCFILLAPPSSTLFPYTTLFRSLPAQYRAVGLGVVGGQPHVLVELGYARPRGVHGAGAPLRGQRLVDGQDRKSTRLNSSHRCISYAVFCLKKKIR